MLAKEFNRNIDIPMIYASELDNSSLGIVVYQETKSDLYKKLATAISCIEPLNP